MVIQHDLNRKIIDKSIYSPYGIEIEAEGIEFELGTRVLGHKITDDWNIKIDNSLTDGGIELASPVLDNTKENIIRLKKIASTLEFLGATFKNASFQINFDAYDLTSNDIIYLLKIFSIYENVIYRFSTGIDSTLRQTVRDFAFPISKAFFYLYNNCRVKEDSYSQLINDKSLAISLKTKTKNDNDPIKVIEFRTPNGTSDFYLWMNYIVFFSSFLTCIKNKKYDREYIDYLFDIMEFKTVEDLIRIDEVKANEFAQLIYQSDIEKECFFKQYYDKQILRK